MTYFNDLREIKTFIVQFSRQTRKTITVFTVFRRYLILLTI